MQCPTPALTERSNPARASRLHALEHALLVANASLSDERARRAKWERRAVVSKAEQTAQQEELTYARTQLKEARKNTEKAEACADTERRARKLAEEQKEIALKRLSNSIEDSIDTQLKTENNSLKAQVERMRIEFKDEKQRLSQENEQLQAEMDTVRAAIQQEREKFVTELAERTKNFANLEKELKDARETYITAAKTFETQQKLNKRQGTEKRRSIPSSFANINTSSAEGIKLEHFKRECERLEKENANLKKVRVLPASNTSSENKTRSSHTSKSRLLGKESPAITELRERLACAEAERDLLRNQISLRKNQTDASERLSSSSMSSNESGTYARKVQELEVSLEEESRESELLRKKVAGLTETAARTRNEASHLRGGIEAIHMRMRRMATLSIPKGAEELLADDEDARRLMALRDEAKKDLSRKNSLAGNGKKKVPVKRRTRILDNKKISRPWVH